MLNPDFIPPEVGFPVALVLWAIYFVMGSKDRREARKARK